MTRLSRSDDVTGVDMATTWLEDYFDSWGGTDPDKVVSYMADDVEFEDTTMKHPSSGKEKVRRFVALCFKMVPDVKYEVVDFHLTDTAYWVEWIMQPNGVRGASVGKVRDGKIIYQHDYWDGREFQPESLEK
jgi:ketosteroid isomerase-like protein